MTIDIRDIIGSIGQRLQKGASEVRVLIGVSTRTYRRKYTYLLPEVHVLSPNPVLRCLFSLLVLLLMGAWYALMIVVMMVVGVGSM